VLTIGLVARDQRAAQVSLAHDEILRRGRRRGVGRASGFVGRETALNGPPRIVARARRLPGYCSGGLALRRSSSEGG
jgi:hypothetical protein